MLLSLLSNELTAPTIEFKELAALLAELDRVESELPVFSKLLAALIALSANIEVALTAAWCFSDITRRNGANGRHYFHNKYAAKLIESGF
jgi:hypothetical protein